MQPKVRNSSATEQLISVNRHMWVAAYWPLKWGCSCPLLVNEHLKITIKADINWSKSEKCRVNSLSPWVGEGS